MKPHLIVCTSSHGYHIPAERASCSKVETDLIIGTIEMAAKRKESILEALCVLNISWLLFFFG
jgi:hypothetical protein